VLIDLPQGVDLFSPEALKLVAEVHKKVEGQPGIGNVWSVETLRRWLAGELDPPAAATPLRVLAAAAAARLAFARMRLEPDERS
jgi:hypothetical protein